MRGPVHRRLVTVGLVAVLGLGVACSKGRPSSATGGPANESGQAAGSPHAASDGRESGTVRRGEAAQREGQAIARSTGAGSLASGLLAVEDLGSGWRAASTSPTDAVDPTELVALCGRAVPSPPEDGVTALFVKEGAGDVVTHTVRRYSSGQAIPAVGTMAEAGIACEQWPVGARRTRVGIQPLVTPDVGERWVGFRLRSVDAAPAFAADVIAWQRGNYISVLTTVGFRMLDADLTKRLLPIADARLERLVESDPSP